MLFRSTKPVHFTEEETEVEKNISDLVQDMLGWYIKLMNGSIRIQIQHWLPLQHAYSPLSHADSDNGIIMSKERSSYERLLIFKLKREYQNSKDAQLSDVEIRRNQFIG